MKVFMKVFTTHTALCLGAATFLMGLLAATPTMAQDPTIVTATFSEPTAGLPGSGIGGDGYTPYFFDITFENDTDFTYTVTDPPTFNTTDPTTVNYINTDDIITFYDPNNAYLPFDLGFGETVQSQVFEFDVDGNIPGGTTLTGDLDFEGTRDTAQPEGIGPQGGPMVTVADPTFSFVTPAGTTTTPEPASYAAFIVAGLGLGGLMLRAHRRSASQKS